MGKLLKFLKPYAGAVVAIICILVVQAYCDLSLPTYTSDIVNVGIQQGGIDETVPDAISKKDLNHLLLLVPSDKQELVKNAYTKSTKKYDYKGTVMELKSSVKEDDKKMEKLSDILGKPMLLAAGFDSGSDMTQRSEGPGAGPDAGSGTTGTDSDAGSTKEGSSADVRSSGF